MVLKRIYILLGILTIGFVFKSFSQETSFHQFSGTVRNGSYQPVEFVHVYNVNLQKGTVSGVDGRFSIVCLKSDTVLFSVMGYKKLYFPVPDTLSDKFVFHDIYLDEDTFHIREVMIFPWKTYEEFKKAFLALDISDKDQENAQHNIELIKKQIMANNAYSDPGMSYRYAMDAHANQLMNIGVPPINNLLNPIAWGRFIESIKNNGSNKRNKRKK